MSFYGLNTDEETARVYELLLEIAELYAKSNIPTFIGDNLAALGRNMGFSRDQRFMRAFEDNLREKVDQVKLWRLHTYCWVGQSATKLPGDFVECGVFQGFYSAVLLQYLDFAASDKRMWLYDTFSGLSEEYSTEEERKVVGGAYKGRPGWYEDVSKRFEMYANVEVIRGIVPHVLRDSAPETIAMLHLDMNAGSAEVAALDVLFDRVVVGGFVLLDDFGRFETSELHHALEEWLKARGHPVLELPTGQGLVVKQREGPRWRRRN